jgi:hypothetical protein
MFENDDPHHRGALLKALRERGLDAVEFNSGGGTMHVIVALIDYVYEPSVNTAESQELRSELENSARGWPHESYLYISTNSLQTNCEIGLMGLDGRTGAQVSHNEWEPVESLEDAVEVFQKYWNERDKWVRAFVADDLVKW